MRIALLAFVLAMLGAVAPAFADTQCRTPTANGTNFNAWQLGAGSDKPSAVTDTINADCTGRSDDSDTSYIEEDTTDQYQEFQFTAFSITSSAITQVDLCIVGRDVMDGGIIPGLRVNGANYLGAEIFPTNSYAETCTTWATNPDTSAAWTEADVEGTGTNPLQSILIGANAVGVGDEVRVTQAYIKVTYTAVGGGAPSCGRLALLGVGC